MATDTTQFIWLYIDDEACGDELRYSMRSVYAHFAGSPHITLVGDKPDWYCGHYINIPKIPVPKYARFHSPLDQSHKLYTILSRSDVADNFVVMMDDHYFLKRFSLESLLVPRAAAGWTPKNRYWWDNAITTTMQALERRGMSTHLYETHLMHVFERERLRYIFDTFSLQSVPRLRNTLYGNMFRKSPKNCRPFIVSPQTRQNSRQLDTIAKSSTVLNHASNGWDNVLRKWLNHRLHGISPVECETETSAPV